MSLEPVRMGSDELYHILRTRLFEKLPTDDQVAAVAQTYAKAMRDAKQMDITSESPEQFAARISAAYPFHPFIRRIIRRTRQQLEQQIDPDGREPLLKPSKWSCSAKTTPTPLLCPRISARRTG
jgi:hypothetical protein